MILRIRIRKKTAKNSGINMVLLDCVEGEVNLDDCISIGLHNLFGLAQVTILFLAQDQFL